MNLSWKLRKYGTRSFDHLHFMEHGIGRIPSSGTGISRYRHPVPDRYWKHPVPHQNSTLIRYLSSRNFRREERFLFLSSSLLSLTLSFSSSLSSSPAVSLSHDANFRCEERFLFLSSLSFSEIISFFLPLFLLSLSPSPSLPRSSPSLCLFMVL